jgi:tetratricopeptide (TPR) repeat protein
MKWTAGLLIPFAILMMASCHQKESADVRLAEASKLIAEHPEQVEYYFDRVNVLTELGATDSVISVDLKRIVEIDPLNKDAHFMLGVISYGKDRFADAINELSAAIRIDSVMANAYSIRSLCHASLKDYSAAIQDISIKIRLRPERTDYHFRGDYQMMTGMYPDAIASYDSVLAFAGGDVDSVFYCVETARLLSLTGNNAKALTRINQIGDQKLSLKPAYLFQRGVILFRVGDYNRAKDDLTNSIELTDSNSYSHWYLSLVNLKIGKKERALIEFQRAVQAGFSDQDLVLSNEILRKSGLVNEFVMLMKRKSDSNRLKQQLLKRIVERGRIADFAEHFLVGYRLTEICLERELQTEYRALLQLFLDYTDS